MSRHIPRSARWTQHGPNEYTSAESVVRFERGAWWALVSYQQCDPVPSDGALLVWHAHHDRLGPFRRPRNAMIAAEEHTEILRRRHGDGVRFTATPA